MAGQQSASQPASRTASQPASQPASLLVSQPANQPAFLRCSPGRRQFVQPLVHSILSYCSGLDKESTKVRDDQCIRSTRNQPTRTTYWKSGIRRTPPLQPRAPSFIDQPLVLSIHSNCSHCLGSFVLTCRTCSQKRLCFTARVCTMLTLCHCTTTDPSNHRFVKCWMGRRQRR